MRLAQIIARLAELDIENNNKDTSAERILAIGGEIKTLTTEKTQIESTPPAIDGVAAERQRASDITALCRDFEVEPDAYIKDGKTVDSVREAILTKLKNENPASKGTGTNVTVVKDAMDKFREAASDALMMKGGINLEKPADGARDLRSASIIDIARECLMIEGKTAEARIMDKADLVRAAFTASSQFSGILDNTVNKTMQRAYTEASVTYPLWTSKGSLSDFKATNRYQISESGDLLKINENGEFVDDKMTDSGVSNALITYGRKFSMSRQAIINDDLSYLTKIPAAYARAAKRGINKAVYAILNGNPVIYDGDNLFSAGHANAILSGGATPTVEELDLLQQKMMKQKNLRGLEMLNIRPKFLIVPVELDVKTRQLISSTNDPATTTGVLVPNPFNGRLEVISDAELTGAKKWFTAADPSNIDTIEVAYLNGNDMPTLESKVGWDTLGMEWRIFIDYGVTVIDYRGLGYDKGEA